MQDEVLGVYKSVVWIASLPLALKVILETKFLKEFSQHSNELDYLSIKLKVRMQIKSIALFGAISILLSLIFGNQLLELVFTKELANSGYHYFPLIILTTFIFLLAVPLANALQSIEHENVFKLAITTNLITYCITTTMLYDSLGVKVFIISSLILNSIMFIFLINKTVSIFSPKP